MNNWSVAALARKFLLISVLFAFPSSRVEGQSGIEKPDAALEVEPLTLAVGEAATIDVGEEDTIHVSRKGPVDIVLVRAGVWQVVGLRPGVVVVTVRDANGDEVARRLYNVVELSTHKHPLFDNNIWHNFICKRKGVRCDLVNHAVYGVSDDFRWFATAKVQCAKQQPCLFHVVLKPESADRTLKHLSKQLAPWYQVQILPGGEVLATEDCQGDKPTSDRVNFLTDGGVEEGWLRVECSSSVWRSPLTFRAKVFLIEANAADELGLDWESINFRKIPEAKLNALSRAGVVRIVAEPEIQFRPMETLGFHDGGEFFAEGEGEADSKVQHWKKYGFIFSGIAKFVGENRVALSYEVELSQVSSGSGLKKSSIKSEVEMALGKVTLLGFMKNISVERSGEEHLILAHIPILGPLFRSVNWGGTLSHLLASVEISRSS